MSRIKIGQIVGAVGLKGEVKVYPVLEDVQRFQSLKRLWLEDKPIQVEGQRSKGSLVILKLAGVGDRNASEALKGKSFFMEEDDLPDLPQGTYYVRDLLGMDVEDQKRGIIGILKDVRGDGPQSHLVIERPDGREILVPAVEAFFTGVDPARRMVLVELIGGMYED